MGIISFINDGIDPKIRGKKKLKIFLARIFKDEKVPLDRLSYIFCKDDSLLTLNQNFLKHDTFTDVLTFPLSEKGEKIEAEIYISVERVIENAQILKVDYKHELLRVIIHGILHLCGHADHTSLEKSSIRKKEDYYLSKYCST